MGVILSQSEILLALLPSALFSGIFLVWNWRDRVAARKAVPVKK
jgi:hypothetical protein